MAPPARAGRLIPASLRPAAVVLCLVFLAGVLSACGASSALQNAVLAPLSAIPQTDVVLETNLQSATEAGQTGASLSGLSGLSSTTGVPETSGAPTTPSVVSVASASGVSVYTAFNPADGHCLGTLVISSGSDLTVLGESAPGSYDFWFDASGPAACTASIFTTEASVPSGWATGDPASSWPGP